MIFCRLSAGLLKIDNPCRYNMKRSVKIYEIVSVLYIDMGVFG
ncbi:hypothetical protein BN188_280015 [Clostridioides difficile T19]|nr:hypothetical protein BN188_280015 [Clostridioides difficile T19]